MLFSKNWLEGFKQEIENELCQEIESQKDRFPSYNRLLKNFRNKVKSFDKNVNLLESLEGKSQETNGEIGKHRRSTWKSWAMLIEAHNELCVAYEILFQQIDVPCVKLEYEPAIQNSSHRIDFHVTVKPKDFRWVEVKTIHPDDMWLRAMDTKTESKNIEKKDWSQFRSWRVNFPDRTELLIPRSANGGDIWHDKKASRAHMLEYSLEFEERIGEFNTDTNELFTLAFVGNGYDWRFDELEDFVTFYKTDRHLLGDIFQKIENYDIQAKGIILSRKINCFAYIQRSETEIKPDKVIWDIKPPRWPATEK